MPDDETILGMPEISSIDDLTLPARGNNAADLPTQSLPASIGHYRIIRLLGEGGMGAVYEAEQDQPRRLVALKVIKAAWASPDLVRRFEQESQALGRLHHPGIAQIYEAGSADAGFGEQPFFAMELIHGKPLVEYADVHTLNTRQRLELMIQVCDAVHHAHQRGIIHRDLKPGNILVDQSGLPRILDFGLARATDSDAQATRQTDIGQLLGTLAYMSPEQALADPLALDTRSDVYALGVILYELLAGKMPYTLSRQLHEAMRTIKETDPAPLSTVSRMYRGDIETIAAKALEKDKTRRYASAAELAADIGRYLHDEPIVARPASTAYQLRKFARRNKALVTGVACVFAVLVLGIVASTFEAIQARRAEVQAVKSEKKARQESETAQAVTDFLRNDLLAQAGPTGQSGPNSKPDPDMKVRTALDRAAAHIEGKFGKRPELESAIRETLGETYTDLGLYPEARKQFERTLDLRRRVLGAEDPKTIETMDRFAQMAQAEGNYADADAMATQAYETSRRVLGSNSPETLRVMQMLGWIEYREGKFQQAETLDKQALAVSRRVLSGDNIDTVHLLGNLAANVAAEGKSQEAESLDMQRLEMSRRVQGPEGPDTLGAMNDLAGDYEDEGKRSEAEQLYAQVVDIRKRTVGPEHPDTLVTMANLASAYINDGKFAEAVPLLEQVTKSSARVLGPNNMDTLNAMENLAMAYVGEGRAARGEALLTETLQRRRQAYGAGHPSTLQCQFHLTDAFASHGDLRHAEKSGRELLAAERHAAGATSLDAMYAQMQLAEIYVLEGKYAQAEPLARGAAAAFKSDPPNSLNRAFADTTLGAALAGGKHYDEAEPMLLHGYRVLVARRDQVDAPSRYRIALAHKWLVQLYRDWGKPGLANEWDKR
ncbi:MAG TPA: serine/threonine-protein kinase [Acidobacteriaceae bacterium]|nr:serine/threonine-protein kinase [Acidobacteriaceae bacterium]